MRTAGRIFAGLFMGVVLFFGLGGAAHAQTPTPTPRPTPTPNTSPSSSTTTTVRTGTTGGGGLAKTGTDLGVPIALGGGALVITMVLRRVLAND